jgi:4-hydroxy-4-methyl-2-oxoglutarate aldolase
VTAAVGVAPAVIARYEKLYSSLVSDCIEELGLGVRVCEPGFAPYHADQLRVVVGPAHTAQLHRTSKRVEIDTLLAMVEATPPTSVVVVAADEDIQGATWGGLMSAGVQRRGAVGAVCDGGIRDLHQILPLDFAVWARYRSPADIRGRGEMVGYGDPVLLRGVLVQPGELVFADANGVVIVPAGAELDVLERCEARASAEVQTEAELRAGADASDVYRRHGAF